MGKSSFTQVPSLPRGRSTSQPLRPNPEVRVGSFLDGVVGKRLQIRELRGSEDNEVLASLLVGVLR